MLEFFNFATAPDRLWFPLNILPSGTGGSFQGAEAAGPWSWLHTSIKYRG